MNNRDQDYGALVVSMGDIREQLGPRLENTSCQYGQDQKTPRTQIREQWRLIWTRVMNNRDQDYVALVVSMGDIKEKQGTRLQNTGGQYGK